MIRSLSSTSSHRLRAVLAGVLVALFASASAGAAPLVSERSLSSAEQSSPADLSVGTATVSLETSTPAIPSGEPFGFTVRVRSAEPITYLQVRAKLKRASGRLIFQRTRIEHNVDAGERSFHFERATSDLDLRPGVYPLEIEATVQDSAGTTNEVLTSGMLVYDGETPPLDVVFVARVTGQPLSGPHGRFVHDPGRYRTALDEVDAILAAVDSDARHRVTLAVPPMLVEEWRRVASGYELEGPEGIEQVPATDQVAQDHARVLERLASAVRSGRVELLSTGFSDPNLSELDAHGMTSDVNRQYQQGISAMFASIESTPSTGTAPAAGCVPPRVADALVAEDVAYVIVDDRCTRRGDATVTAGLYGVADTGLKALVSDKTASQALLHGDLATVSERAFLRHIDEGPRAPFVLVADIGPAGPATVAEFLQALRGLTAQPWIEGTLGRDAASGTGPRIGLAASAPDRKAPSGYWDAVATGRRWAAALSEAQGAGHPGSMVARSSSLIAQSAAWSHAGWALAERGATYAEAATEAGQERLGGVQLSVRSVTLAGTQGTVPVTVNNPVDHALTVRLGVQPSENVRVLGDRVREVTLSPQDNFFEVPVDLQNVLSGRLTVTLVSGDVVIDREVVTVHASYLDRLAIIGGVVMLLGGMLAFIIRRVNSSQPVEGWSVFRVPSAAEQYTGTPDEEDDVSDSPSRDAKAQADGRHRVDSGSDAT